MADETWRRQIEHLLYHIQFGDIKLRGNLIDLAVVTSGEQVFEQLDRAGHTLTSEEEERQVK